MCSTPPRRPQSDLAKALAAAARKPTTPPRLRRWLERLLADDQAKQAADGSPVNNGSAK